MYVKIMKESNSTWGGNGLAYKPKLKLILCDSTKAFWSMKTPWYHRVDWNPPQVQSGTAPIRITVQGARKDNSCTYRCL
jgi:hypothetical protein